MGESGCPACGAPIAADARFCTGCGAALTVTCPGCGRAAEPGHRFCAGCGRPLDTGLSAQPAAVPPRSQGERKQVTVLFADVAGSMEAAERFDPEDWAALMDRFFRVLSEGIARFGGTVDKFTGDGVMALFGAPVSQEDHARRACHAALYLREATAGLDLPVRIGLNSGEAVVGEIGEHGPLEYTALGHTVGLAQRMEALADPGSVFLSERTARLVGNDFAIRDLGPQAVKGSREPLRVFVLETSRRRRPTGGSTVMVGRAEEMGVLEAALARALEGQAQVLGIVGEAGVGKSRLCEEFARSATARGITVRRAAGLSHAQDVPLLPVLDFLRDYFGIDDTDSRGEAQEKIAARLLALYPGFEDSLPLLFDFLEVPDNERPVPRMSPEVRMERIFAVIRRITQRRSDREALILLFEDLHWFDPHSRAFVERLIPSFPGTRTLVLTNFRPEFTPPWALHSYYRQLPLQPLDEEAVGRLLEGLLGRDDSLAPLVKLIADTTGGSPFFVEEVVRSLVEDGSLTGEPGAYRIARPVGHLAVPPTVQATLGARIDRLAGRERAVLQTAAVIGRNFTEPVLGHVCGLAAGEIADSLRRLGAAEFIQEVTLTPVEEYRFWHPLTQEVAYGTLLRERRAALHGAVAEAIIATDPDRLDERAALIAVHYERSGNALEAARWNDRAGDFAIRRDLREAMRRWRLALNHLESAPEGQESLALGLSVRTRLLRYMARRGVEPSETSRLYAEARELASLSGAPMLLASAMNAYASTRFWAGAVTEALNLYQEAFELARQHGDIDALVAYGAAIALGSCGWVTGASFVRDLLDEVDQALAGNSRLGRSVYGFTPLSPLALARVELHALQGQWEAARRALDEGLELTRAAGDTEWTAWLLSTAPRLARSRDEYETSLAQAQEALLLAEQSGNTANEVVCLGGVGIALVALGRYQEAAEVLSQALDVARSRNSGLFEEGRLLANLARSRLGLGDGAGALTAVDEAVEVTRRQGARIIECLALLTRARVTRAVRGPGGEVTADLEAALTVARETGATAYETDIEAERAGAAAAPK